MPVISRWVGEDGTEVVWSATENKGVEIQVNTPQTSRAIASYKESLSREEIDYIFHQANYVLKQRQFVPLETVFNENLDVDFTEDGYLEVSHFVDSTNPPVRAPVISWRYALMTIIVGDPKPSRKAKVEKKSSKMSLILEG